MTGTDYAIYDLETGMIVKAGYCPEEDELKAALQPGQGIFLGEALDARAFRVIEGKPVPYPYEPPIEDARADALADLDRAAGQCRAQFLTVAIGQELVYADKRREAEQILAGNTSGIVYLTREADLDGMTLLDKARDVMARAHDWEATSAGIEFLRLRAKRAIQSACTHAEIREALRIDWPTASSGGEP